MPKGRVRVREVDHGWAQFKRNIDAFTAQRPRIATGIIGEAASAPHPPRRRRGAKKADETTSKRVPLTLVQIAQIHEFGAGHNPERSFLRANFDNNRIAYQKYLVNGLRREILAATKSGQQLDTSSSVTLKRLALKVEGDVKKRIKSRIPPPNAPSTIRRKGSSVPLVDTGALLRQVGSEIRRAGAQ